MQNDSIYDTVASRPLPKWLTDQKAGLTTAQPQKIVIKHDESLHISFLLTGVFVILVVAVLTIYITKKHNRNRI